MGYRMQTLADNLGLSLTVCHFPPGTSKWNKIEHRMFCHITPVSYTHLTLPTICSV